jgi:hypothetical protein
MATASGKGKKAFFVELYDGHDLVDTEYKDRPLVLEADGRNCEADVKTILAAAEAGVSEIYVIDPSSISDYYSDEDDERLRYEGRLGTAVDYTKALLTQLGYKPMSMTPEAFRKRLPKIASK